MNETSAFMILLPSLWMAIAETVLFFQYSVRDVRKGVLSQFEGEIAGTTPEFRRAIIEVASSDEPTQKDIERDTQKQQQHMAMLKRRSVVIVGSIFAVLLTLGYRNRDAIAWREVGIQSVLFMGIFVCFQLWFYNMVGLRYRYS